MKITWAALAAGAALAVAGTASAAPVTSGLYRLHNHPDGAEAPPLYGARFDELYNATGNHDVYTLNFDDADSAVFMDVNLAAGTIHIFGTSKGGRDNGGGYAAGVDNGLYTLNFVYNLGVAGVPGDDDVWVNTANHVNVGTILTARGDVVNLVDERGSNPFSLRLGDEDNDAGHRGFPGMSGWGWMSYVRDNGIVHNESTDWLFTATLVPEPASLGLLLVGALAAFRRRA